METPGGLVYNVLLDDPPDQRFNTLTYLGDDMIIENLSQDHATHEGSEA